MLKEVKILKEEEGLEPRFIKKPTRLTIQREGDEPRIWEMVKGMGTVHVLINKVDSKELLLAKQLRPPVLSAYPETKGICYEVCAGMIDKYKEVETKERAKLIALDEIHEEMRLYKVDINDLEVLPTYISNVGTSGSTCYPFYCEVEDSDFIGQALEPSEDVEVVAVPYDEVIAFLNTETNTDATTRQLLQWFIIREKINELM